MKAKIIPIVMILIASQCFAITMEELGGAENAIEELAPIVNNYIPEINKAVKEAGIPEFVLDLFGNERINVHIELDSGEEKIVGVVAEQFEIKKIIKGGLNDNTMNVHVTEKLIGEIIESENPANELVNALKLGKIKYEGIGFVSAVKYGTLSIVHSILNVFGFLEYA